MMQYYCLLLSAGGSGVSHSCTVFIIWLLIGLLVLMNRSLQQVLIGAVQPCLDCFVADFNSLQLSRRSHSVMGFLPRLVG